MCVCAKLVINCKQKEMCEISKPFCSTNCHNSSKTACQKMMRFGRDRRRNSILLIYAVCVCVCSVAMVDRYLYFRMFSSFVYSFNLMV